MAQSVKLNKKNASKQPFVVVLRELVRAYQAFVSFDARHIRQYGITVPQADVIFTLGNTKGMVFKELGEHTLTTKGTLTGIVDRLEQKGLVKRSLCPKDRRQMYVLLTNKGEKFFNKVFPIHMSNLQQQFNSMTKSDMNQAVLFLKKIKRVF